MYQRIMKQSVGSQGLAAVQLERRTIETAHLAPGFLHNQHARRRVPRTEIEFPETVVASAGHIAQVEGSRSCPAHTVGPQRDLMIEKNVRVLMPLVAGESGREQGFFQLANLRYVNGLAIQLRSLAGLGAEQFIPGGIVN